MVILHCYDFGFKTKNTELKNIKLTRTRIIINSLLFIVFSMFAFVQLNDPDPIRWVTLYGIVALISLFSNFRKIPRSVIYLFTVILLVYAGFHFTYFIDYLQIEDKNELFGKMVYEKPYLEGTREFLGLIMAAGALLFQLTKTD